MNNISGPALSVIVPAYNAEATIRQCLEGVQASTFRDFELIVVDDCSTDRTADIVRSFACKLIRAPENLGPGRARNLGVAHASGRVFYFLDADILVKPGTFASAMNALESHPESSALFGSFEKDTPANNFVSKYKNLLHYYTHQTSREDAATFCGGFGMIRRGAFCEACGFDPKRRFMEDVDLGMRLYRTGHRIRLEKDLRVTHLKRYTFLSLIRSDVVGRAIPWTRLMLDSRVIRNDLNTRIHNVASVPVSFLLLAAVLVPNLWSPFGLPLCCAAMILIALNRGFFGFVRRERGFAFLLGAIPMCWFGYLYSAAGAGFAWCGYLRDRFAEDVAVPLRPPTSTAP